MSIRFSKHLNQSVVITIGTVTSVVIIIVVVVSTLIFILCFIKAIIIFFRRFLTKWL